MLKTMVDRKVFLIVFVVLVVIGVFCKCMVNLALKRLVKAAENMSKSNHSFIRLIRAKFEHACMVSERLENVEVFVDKYFYEYQVMGIRLHSLRRAEWICALLCVVTGAFGAGVTYLCYGMTDQVLQAGAFGCASAIFIYLFSLTTDENFRIEVARNYMVDYLENVCLHKYEKASQKTEERFERMETVEKEELRIEQKKEEEPEKEKEPETEKIIQPFQPKQSEPVIEDKEILIRKILEEFMA